MATEPATEFALEGPAAFEEEAKRAKVAGLGPWKLALRRLRRNKAALVFGALFLVIVGICLAAPYWANHVAHTDPYKNHLTDTVKVGGKKKDVVNPDGKPIGPTWRGRFFLGADTNGRDIAVRLLYGGRTSLVIGVGAALITALMSVVFGLAAGYFRGIADAVISRSLDLIWSFPVILLGVALGTRRRWGERPMVSRPLARSVPRDGSGGWTPAPRNDSAASRRIALAISRVKKTRIVEARFGTTSLNMIRIGPAPCARAASTNSFSRSDSTCPRTGLAMYGT